MSGGIVPFILNLGTRCMGMNSQLHVPALHPVEIAPVTRQETGGPQSRSGLCKKEKNYLPRPGIERQFVGC